jgi:hypothetical protein
MGKEGCGRRTAENATEAPPEYWPRWKDETKPLGRVSVTDDEKFGHFKLLKDL